jgi:hypothetical protein
VKLFTSPILHRCHFSRVDTWSFPMKHAGSIVSLNAPPVEHASRRRIGRRNVFMRIIEALRYSRELEAARIHRRFRHLNAKPHR